MSAQFILGALGFPYSITPGATPDADLVKTAGIAINVVDHVLFSKDHEGNMFSIGTSYDAVLQEHFTSHDPHNVIERITDTGNLTLDGSARDYEIMRFGNANATITVDVENLAQNARIHVDNVWANSGTVTLVSSTNGTTFQIDEATTDTQVSLTGKGQFELVVDVANNVVYLTHLES